jgi:hypothetical protein
MIPTLELIEEPVTCVLRVAPNVENHLNLLEIVAFHKPKSQTKDEVIFVLSAAIVHDDGQLLTGGTIFFDPPELTKPFNEKRGNVISTFPPRSSV